MKIHKKIVFAALIGLVGISQAMDQSMPDLMALPAFSGDMQLDEAMSFDANRYNGKILAERPERIMSYDPNENPAFAVNYEGSFASCFLTDLHRGNWLLAEGWANMILHYDADVVNGRLVCASQEFVVHIVALAHLYHTHFLLRQGCLTDAQRRDFKQRAQEKLQLLFPGCETSQFRTNR